MATVASVITRMQRKFPDIDGATALEYLNLTHQELCVRIPLSIQSESISLTAGTFSYAIHDDDVKVWHVEYMRSATDIHRLEASHWETWNQEQPQWRMNAQAEPTRYAIHRDSTDQAIYLWSPPNLTTSGGYPVIRLWVTRYVALTSNGDLPPGLVNSEVYAFGAMMRYAFDHDHASYGECKARYGELLKAEDAHHVRKDAKAPPRMTQGINYPRGTR